LVKINMQSVNFATDPLTEHKINQQMMKNQEFARIINTNITNKIYDYMKYKVQMKENINFALKGETRSGKSTVGLGMGIYISSLAGMPFMADRNICKNESEYYEKVKHAKFNEVYQIDEQKEAKFGIGSFREEMSIMDIQNIIAKQCVHTIWIYPSDFIARNSTYGFETYGKDLANKLVRCIVYDLRKTMMGMMTPIGYCIIPKYQEPAYQQMPEDQWSKYRLKNKYELKRLDFDSQIEEDYEMKKDSWIEQEKRGQAGSIAEQRLKIALWLKKQKIYEKATSRKKQIIVARQLFSQLTTAEIEEIVELTRMELDVEEVKKAQKKSEKIN